MTRQYDLPADKTLHRILIIKWSALGDVVISTALFEDIRRAFPDAELVLNTSPAFAGLFADDPRFAEVFALDLRSGARGMLNTIKLLKKVRQGRYDLIVDLQANDRSRLLMTLLSWSGARIPYRMNHHTGRPYNVVPCQPLQGIVHSYDRQRSALDAGGIPISQAHPKLHVADERQRHVAKMIQERGLRTGEYAVLMPGCQAAGHLKRWGAENYAALAKHLHETAHLQVVLVGASDDFDECAAIEHVCDGDWLHNLTGQTQIIDLVPLCEAAHLIVSNDTGTAHVASCTTTPMLVVCGPTDPRRVKPVGEHVVAIQAECDCINCYMKECRHNVHHLCMKSISVDMVLDKLKTMKVL